MSAIDPLVRDLVGLVIQWEAGGARQPVHDADHPTYRALVRRENDLSAVLAAARAVVAVLTDDPHEMVDIVSATVALRAALAAADAEVSR